MSLVSSRKKSGKHIDIKSHREGKVTGKGRREWDTLVIQRTDLGLLGSVLLKDNMQE